MFGLPLPKPALTLRNLVVKITCPLGQIIQSPLNYGFKYVPKLRAVTENEEMGTPWIFQTMEFQTKALYAIYKELQEG